jgi:hypothetical protein
VAASFNGNPAAAWINQDGSISAGAAGRPLTPLGNTTNKAVQIALLGTRDTPGVLWTSQTGVFVQLSGGLAAQLTQCETRAGVYTSASATSILGDFWLTSWTKAGGLGDNTFLGTEGRGVGCTNSPAPICAGVDSDCGADAIDQGIRNPASTTATRAGDPPGRVYAATAAPFLGPNQAGTALEAALVLLVARIDFGEVPFQTEPVTEPIGELELSRMAPQGVVREGPDFPAISILPPDRLAVAWIEPRGTGDVLRSQRLKICAPP